MKKIKKKNPKEKRKLKGSGVFKVVGEHLTIHPIMVDKERNTMVIIRNMKMELEHN